MSISADEIRRRILIALFSDDELMNDLVLKGGNALALVHNVGSRASFDMDFSIQNAFADFDATKVRVFNALLREFATIGYVVFDEKFGAKPVKRKEDLPDWWGGYLVEFKLAERSLYEKLSGNLDALRKQSEVLGPQQKRTYTIDISQNEFCAGKIQREINDYIVYVYSLEMIALEKLRAICQQMPEYAFGTKTPRARDFYDIHQIVKENGIDLSTKENQSVLVAIFSAKEVSLSLLNMIGKYRDFHAPDWAAVEASISGAHEDFDYYFDFVVALASDLHALGVK
jgi:hypothetical protein